jgi:hypothetical protein
VSASLSEALAKSRAVLADAIVLTPITPAHVANLLALLLDAVDQAAAAMAAIEPEKAAAAGGKAAEIDAQLLAALELLGQLEDRMRVLEKDIDALMGDVGKLRADGKALT